MGKQKLTQPPQQKLITLGDILDEYRRVTAPTNRQGYTALTMEEMLRALRQVRVALQEEQNRPRKHS